MPRTSRLGVRYDRIPIIDVHTHTSGPDEDGPPTQVVKCMDGCGVEQSFVFAPLLEPHALDLTDEHLDDIRLHNDYIAHFAPSLLSDCSPLPSSIPIPALPGVTGSELWS